MEASDYAINQKFVILFVVLILFNVRFSNSPSKKNRNLRNRTLISKTKTKNEEIAIDPPTNMYYYNYNYIDEYDEFRSMYNPYMNPEKKIDYWNITKVPKGMYINRYYENEIKFFHFFQKLKKMPKNMSSPIVQKEKRDIFTNISNSIGMNVSSIDEIHLRTEFRFGNELIIINKLIFYCELIGVKKIIINKDNNLYINSTIYDKEYNLTIEINKNDDYNSNITDYTDPNIYQNNYLPQMENPGYNPSLPSSPTFSNSNCFPSLFSIFFNLKIENRFNVIKSEILKNLPKVKVDPNDLYIHIRGGDIFSKDASSPSYAPSYAQPPLCFYTQIIEKNNFSKIHIISEDNLNPIINKLLTKYKNIIHQNNTLENDISYLVHAYNIVASISSFITSIIKLNDNLVKFWEYDIYQMEHKLYHMHHSLYEYQRNYTIYRMEPSEKYKKEMYIWTRSDEQIKIMLNDTCPNKFKTILPNKKNN